MANVLIQSRGRVLSSLTKLKTFALGINQATTVDALEVRLQKLDELWTEFKELEDKLAVHQINNPLLNIELKQDEFEEKFFETKAIIVQHVREKNMKSNQQAQPANSTAIDVLLDQQRVFLEGLTDRTQIQNDRSALMSSESIRLPRVNIEPFSGDYDAWPSFQDLYLSSVHNVPSISAAHKFQILKGLLRDKPLQVIRNLLVTDANYPQAWEKLVKRYNKKKPILKSLIMKFMEQNSASSGSASALRRISDVSDEIISGINALGSEAETRDPWLIQILLVKVDEETRELWSRETRESEFPTISDFLQFLNDRCDEKESSTLEIKKKITKPVATVKSMHVNSDEDKCPCCKRIHLLNRCLNFKRMPLSKRRRMVNEYMVCYNCLKQGHMVENCKSDRTCQICSQKHHKLLHMDSSIASTNMASHTPSQTPSTSNSDSHDEIVEETQALNASTSQYAFLPTVIVYIRDNAGNNHKARALLDSGSQSTFISESLVQKLKLSRSYANVKVSGIADTKASTTKGMVNIDLQSRFAEEDIISTSALILTKVTSTIPPTTVKFKNIDEVKHPQLADPTFYIASKIDLLIGADLFFKILKSDQIKVQDNLMLQSTKFGWIVTVKLYKSEELQVFTTVTTEDDTHQLLEKFWKLEEVPSISPRNDIQNECEDHFIKNTFRNSEGRYVVRLPFKSDIKQLGYSKSSAITRLTAMERRFKKIPELEIQYKNFMDEYLKLGHMEKLKSEQINCKDNECFYLPHHAVLKNDSTTTKLRVVFDGSCKSSSGISLNENLLVGPTIQKDLVSLILKFRTKSVAFSADVEKMYRQVEVNEADRNFQRIVWRNSSLEPVGHFRLNTVTYGTSSAPFLAVRVLHKIATDYADSFPEGSKMAINDFYIDDLLSGRDNLNEAKLAYSEISEMLTKGGFILRKWKSNVQEFMDMIPENYKEQSNLSISDNQETVKTLGLQWSPAKDTFSYKIERDIKLVSSKRQMLSQIARIFDPLGWISPVIIIFKCNLQKLWLRKLNWDDALPKDIDLEWKKIQLYISELRHIEVPRYLLTSKTTKEVELHGFSDASENAYGAVIYLRSTNSSGEIHTSLIIAKTKVAPIQQVSLPRLELCGAVLLTKLMKFTVKALELFECSIHAWTDSKIVLAWLSDIPRRWKCFVGNRTSEILHTIPRDKWNYVKSKENPADLASRGVTPTQLLDSTLWWNGPQWLSQPKINWHIEPELESTQLESKSEPVFIHLQLNAQENEILDILFKRISSYAKIKRIIAYILRWNKIYCDLSWIELLRKAEKICIKWAQKENFMQEISSLNLQRKINNKSKLLSLTPFLDDKGILRVGGRLANMDAPFNVKHPIILPKSHILSDLIIYETHIKYLHPGPTLLTSLLKQKYWIINCRRIVRTHINKCIKCYRQRAATSQQLMGSLPINRITPSRPFLHTGVDYAGPILLKSRNGKGRIPIIKGYICVFVCFATKAVHIELVSDMTSEAFIASLRRVISRRGVPVDITSDNGTNFVGAKRELSELYELYKSQTHINAINNFLLQNEITFYFNPASSPHFGGLMESGVKSIKHHLRRVTLNTTMTFEQMATLLTQIESVLNSRPLCPISPDPEDYSALTPGHFLIGEATTTIPEPSLHDIPMNRLSQWQNIQARVQGFWQKWQLDYLHHLQQRPKWLQSTNELKVNDLILVKDDNTPPSKWIMGRVSILHPGKDGLTRVVTIKTSTGELKRPIVKICKLPID